MAKVYGGRWQVLSHAGQGGQGDVFRVRDRQTGSEDWVLKRLRNPKRLGRFRREIEALNAISSPHIPRVADYCTEEPGYLVTPLLGTDLERYCRSNPLSVEAALELFEQLAVGLRDAHGQGVAHRD